MRRRDVDLISTGCGVPELLAIREIESVQAVGCANVQGSIGYAECLYFSTIYFIDGAFNVSSAC